MASVDDVLSMFHDRLGSSRLMHSLVAETKRFPQPLAAEHTLALEVAE